MLRLVSLLFVVAGFPGATSYAANPSVDNNNVCSINLPDDTEWTSTEIWAWDRLCTGRTADLSQYAPAPLESDHKKTVCDPQTADTWPEERRLGPDFFSTITFDSPYKEIIARKGLSLRCAHIEDGIEYYQDERFEQPIRIRDSYLEGGIDFSGLVVKGGISLNNSIIDGDVAFEGAQVTKSIAINNIRIGGDIYAAGVSVEDSLALGDSFVGSIDLTDATLGKILIYGTDINGDIDLERIKSDNFVYFNDVKITGDLLVEDMVLGNDFIISSSDAASVDISGARIDGNVKLSGLVLERGFRGSGVTVQGDMDIENTSGRKMDSPLFELPDDVSWGGSGGALFNLSGGIVQGSLNIESLAMGSLLLGNMVIGRSLSMESLDVNVVLFSSVTVQNVLLFNNSSVDVFYVAGGQYNHIFIDGLCTNFMFLASTVVQGNMGLVGSTIFGDASFGLSEFGGNVVLQSVINGDLDFTAVNIDANLGLNGEYLQDVRLDLTRVGGSVLLTEGRFLGRVDLRGIEIGRELVLATSGHELPDWEEGVELSLRDAQIGDLRHIAASWQDLGGRYGITGLQYERLIFEDGDIPGQEPSWVLDWLKDQKDRSASFNPQPYEELANALRRSGFTGLSNDVSIMKRDHELASPGTGLARKINLFLQKYIIGYGYQTWRVFGWLALLVMTGMYVAGNTRWGRRVGYVRRLFFSLDMLLPQLAQLDKRHEEIKMGGSFVWCPRLPLGIGKQCKKTGPLTMPVQYYFFLHKLVGSILMLFAIAGLSGLTK